MRKLLLGFVLLFFCGSSFASHLMGGEITVKQNAPGEYVVQLSIYRDTLGINVAPTETYDVMDANGTLLLTETMWLDSSVSGTFLPGYPYGVEPYHYRDTIYLNNPGSYTIFWDQCCRNAAILNTSTPSAESMYLSTDLWIDASAANSTPVFLAPPVIYLPMMTPWQYNPMPFDADGDSLSWQIDVPLDASNTPVAGYTAPSADPSGPFSIDPVTGVISWTADMMGNFVTSVLVEEYRNGVKIGEIRRDMQFIVIQAQSSMPTFDNFTSVPLNPSGYPQLDLTVGNSFNFSFLASDQDVNDVLYMYAYSGVFNLPTNPATFSTQFVSGTNQIQGDFSWTPDANAISSDPHLMTLRILDGLFAFDETLMLNVQMSSSLEEQNVATAAEVFPNPSNGVFHLNLNLPEASQTRIAIMDLQGRTVETYTRQLNGGQHLLGFQPDVAAGTYLLQVETEAGVISTQKILISK